MEPTCLSNARCAKDIAMTQPFLVFRIHAIQRMFQRGISKEDVKHALKAGHVIEEYLKDQPYPSRLIMGWSGSRPLHVVVSDNPTAQESIIITVYEPDPEKWDASFRRRRTA
jgi:hypothetical protein